MGSSEQHNLPDVGATTEGPQQGHALESFAERLREILALRPAPAAFAEQAAGLLQELASARAAALLGYDRRRERLVLLAAQNLPREASELLNGGSRGWEIPLRCLRNRRISVVEAAHENPFVPRALASIAPEALTIAALPGYADGRPVLVALLFAADAKGFPDTEVRRLATAVAAIASGLRDPRLAPSAPQQPAPVAGAVFDREAAEPAGQAQPLRQRLEALEQEFAEAQRWVAALAERLRLAEAEGQKRLARAERERDNWKSRAASLENQLREKTRQLQDLAGEQQRARNAARESAAQLAEAQKQVADLQARCRELAEQKQAADTARDAEEQVRAALEAKLQATVEELTGWRQAAAAAQRVKEELEARWAAAQREINALHRALSEREGALATAMARQLELEAALRDAQRQRDEAEAKLARIVATEPMPGADETSLTIERTAPALGKARGAPPTPTSRIRRPGLPPPHRTRLLLLDDPPLQQEAAAVLAESGWDCVAQAPGELAVDRATPVDTVLLNVAASGGWQALWALSHRVFAGAPPLILVYALSPDLPAGFSFGRSDFGPWPPSPADLSARLERLQPRARRLLIASVDVDQAGRLRDALAREKISASVALDGRQACDLAGAVRPEVVVVHLSPTCPDAARALTFLRAAPSHTVPLVVLLEDPHADAVRTFLLDLNRSLQRLGNFDFGRLDTELRALLQWAGAGADRRLPVEPVSR